VCVCVCVCVCVERCPGMWACASACALVTLLIQHATRLRRIVLSLVASLAPSGFSVLCHKHHDFRKKVAGYEMCVLLFPTIFIWKISDSTKNSARYCHECENVIMWSSRYSCRILMKLAFPWQTFEKKSYIKFYQNPSSGSRVVPCGRTDGRTDGHDEASSRFSQICERA
jgi:hypothetical protein